MLAKNVEKQVMNLLRYIMKEKVQFYLQSSYCLEGLKRNFCLDSHLEHVYILRS